MAKHCELNTRANSAHRAAGGRLKHQVRSVAKSHDKNEIIKNIYYFTLTGIQLELMIRAGGPFSIPDQWGSLRGAK